MFRIFGHINKKVSLLPQFHFHLYFLTPMGCGPSKTSIPNRSPTRSQAPANKVEVVADDVVGVSDHLIGIICAEANKHPSCDKPQDQDPQASCPATEPICPSSPAVIEPLSVIADLYSPTPRTVSPDPHVHPKIPVTPKKRNRAKRVTTHHLVSPRNRSRSQPHASIHHHRKRRWDDRKSHILCVCVFLIVLLCSSSSAMINHCSSTWCDIFVMLCVSIKIRNDHEKRKARLGFEPRTPRLWAWWDTISLSCLFHPWTRVWTI